MTRKKKGLHILKCFSLYYAYEYHLLPAWPHCSSYCLHPVTCSTYTSWLQRITSMPIRHLNQPTVVASKLEIFNYLFIGWIPPTYSSDDEGVCKDVVSLSLLLVSNVVILCPLLVPYRLECSRSIFEGRGHIDDCSRLHPIDDGKIRPQSVVEARDGLVHSDCCSLTWPSPAGWVWRYVNE